VSDRADLHVRAAPWVVAGALCLTLVLAWAGKAVCIDGETGFWAVTRYCYSDVIVLWSQRGFDVGAVPYAGPPDGYPVAYTLEYPPGLVFPAWGLSLATASRAAFFHVHALTFAVAAALALRYLDRALEGTRGPGWRRSRWRLLGLALSPGLVLFGMQNWDMWVVLPVAVGLAAAAGGRSVRAAAWFGLAAAIKWWPALLVVTLLAGPWSRDADTEVPDRLRRWGLDLRPALVGGGVWAALQLPAIAISPAGWWQAIAFHLERSPNWDSTAMALARFGSWIAPGDLWGQPFTRLWTVVSLVLLLAGTGYILRRLRAGTLRPEDAALALLVLFLVVGKVFSPQFVVWLVPLAVVSRVGWTPVLAVEAANAAVWLLYGPWMGLWREGEEYWGFLYAAQGMSVVRSLALIWLIAAALRPIVDRRREVRSVPPARS
jgi:uncharacterized membrane protein